MLDCAHSICQECAKGSAKCAFCPEVKSEPFLEQLRKEQMKNNLMIFFDSIKRSYEISEQDFLSKLLNSLYRFLINAYILNLDLVKNSNMKVIDDARQVENLIRQRVISIKQDLDEFQVNSIITLNAIKDNLIKYK